MVTGMDRNIGRLVARLREKNQLDNTLIFFLSDNGACAEWEPFGFDLEPVNQPQPESASTSARPARQIFLRRGDDLAKMGQAGSLFSYGSAWANASNTPWRLLQARLPTKAASATPLIVHWPDQIKTPSQFRQQAAT
jgi:arylsulfatase